MRRLTLLGAGAAALALGALIAQHAPALYDGIGFPDEPYRYAQVVAGDPVKTPPPTTATATVTETAGASATGVVLTSAETGPQVLAYIPKGAILAPATTTVAATPMAPDAPAPADGPVAGDIYRLSPASAATWRPGANGTISLRSPQGIPESPTMEFRPAGAPTWRVLATTRVGNDIWESPLGAFGDYALILPTHPAAAATAAPKSNTVVYLLIAVAVCIAAALLGARLALRKRPEETDVSDGPVAG